MNEELILSDKQFAVKLPDGTLFIANINSIPTLTSLLNSIHSPGEVSYNSNAKLVATGNFVPDGEVKLPNPDKPEYLDKDYRTSLLLDLMPNFGKKKDSNSVRKDMTAAKLFLKGQSKLVITTDGLVFLSLTSAEEYYGITPGKLGKILNTYKYHTYYPNTVEEKSVIDVHNITIKRMLTCYNLYTNNYNNYREKSTYNCCGKQWRSVGPWAFRLNVSENFKERLVGFMVFDNEMYRDTYGGVNVVTNDSIRALTYGIPGGGLIDLGNYVISNYFGKDPSDEAIKNDPFYEKNFKMLTYIGHPSLKAPADRVPSSVPLADLGSPEEAASLMTWGKNEEFQKSKYTIFGVMKDVMNNALIIKPR